MAILISTSAWAQSQVSGTVKGKDGAAIQGATVVVKGSTRGAITDAKGGFTITAAANEMLQVSYLGFKTQDITVGNQTVFTITLEDNSEALDGVVAIGYGKQKKSHLTGSISKVENKTLDQIPIGRVDDALVGQITGVNIQMTNPAAGEAPVIKVRGQGSISFESAPLIVIDGIAVGSDPDYLSSVDMNDVASIEVLKDAASASIYGSRGANGIIMITTKEGVEGPTQFSYNSFVGSKSVQSRDVLGNLDDWLAATADESGIADKRAYIEKFGEGTDWEKVMFDGGLITNHSLSARGGTKNTKFMTSLSYLNDQGVLLTDNYEKLNFRLNLNTKVSDRVSFGVVLNPSRTEQRRFPIGVHDALRQNPWLPLYLTEDNIQYVNRTRENGRWADAQVGDYAMERMFDDFDLTTGAPDPGNSGTDISSTSNQSALAKVLERDRRKYQTKIFTNAFVNVNLTDNLYFKQSLGGDVRFTKYEDYNGVLSSRNGAAGSSARRRNQENYHTISESTLNFSKTIGENHEVNAVGGFAYESWKRQDGQIDASGYTNDLIRTIPAANVIGAYTTASEEALASLLSRVNYAYADKYLVSISARWDGSSKFGPDNKYGFFPAASVGWNIAKEEFMNNLKAVSDLKARASYGVSGSNSGIGEYDYIGLISPVGTAIGGESNGYNATNISNSELRWEKLKEVNVGFDLALLKGRFGASVDFYNRTSSDLLLDLPVPAVTGFQTALVNRGIVENKGFELEVFANPLKSKIVKWRTSALLTHNENTLVDFAGASGLISTVDSKRPAEWIALEGSPISSYYGYVVSGQEIAPEYLKNPFYPIGGQSQDIYVKDLNGDGVIDTDDRTVLGSPYPDFIYSWNNTVSFLGFDVTLMFQGSQGAEVRNISSQYIRNEFSSNQDYIAGFEDADLVVQRIFTSDDIQDADYFALRNLNIGYTFKKASLNKIGLGGLRVYVGGQNLIYKMADNYEGYNPEGIDQGLGNPLTYGYQRGPAPIFRTLSVGVNVKL
ncbi:MAG: SusC/RagA family TonB-linked outer membrane protein [Bacteroidetes bacterium]|nr:SusC/RagA family TonB-linked outer membrane protein [Bacteroidota bacterium]